MQKKTNAATIGVFGHYGNNNIGDEAIIAAVIQNIRKRFPDAKVVGFSINPADTRERHGIPAFPIRYLEERTRPPVSAAHRGTMENVPQADEDRAGAVARLKAIIKKAPVIYLPLKAASRFMDLTIAWKNEAGFLRSSYRAVKELDLLVVCGSNQFLDNFGGAWGFPYTLLKWSLMARFAGVRLAFASVGAGPINSRLSGFLIRTSLKLSDYRSYRDKGSRELINRIGFKGTGRVCPDLAHGLDIGDVPTNETERAGSPRPVVGLNPMPVYDSRYWPDADPGKYEAYIQKLAGFAAALIREGYPVLLFPTQAKDDLVIADIRAMLDGSIAQEGTAAVTVRQSRSIDELIANLKSADIVVATRFHGVLLALLAEKPVLGICYQEKTRELMRDMDQVNYALDLDALRVEDLLERFRELESSTAAEIAKIRKKESEYKATLDEQYEDIFGLLDSAKRMEPPDATQAGG